MFNISSSCDVMGRTDLVLSTCVVLACHITGSQCDSSDDITHLLYLYWVTEAVHFSTVPFRQASLTGGPPVCPMYTVSVSSFNTPVTEVISPITILFLWLISTSHSYKRCAQNLNLYSFSWTILFSTNHLRTSPTK